MTHLKYHTLILFLLLAWTQSKAQTVFYGKIDKFEILSEYLTNGQIKLSNDAYTDIKYKVGFVREFKTMAPPTWMPFDVTVRLSTTTDKGDIILFESPHNIAIANFKQNNVFLDTVLTCRIDNSKVSRSRSIILSYIRNKQSFPNMSFDGRSYLIEQVSTPDPNPKPDLEPIVKADSVLFYSVQTKKGGYSLTSSPSDKERYNSEFYAYNQRVKDSRAIYSYSELGDQGYAYFDTDRVNNLRREIFQKAFYAFGHQVKGTVPIYKHYDMSPSSRRVVKYSPRNEVKGLQNLGIAFYAYPLPAPIPPERHGGAQAKQFFVDPSQWLKNPDGKSYSFSIPNIFPDVVDAYIRSIQIIGQTIAIGGGRSRTETVNIPASFKNNNFDYEFTQGNLIIKSNNIENTAPLEKIEFFLVVLDRSKD
ncbi:hypothetical protein [Pedobacter sp. FW305-3-2-15-E-R2A2]|uniref:hypothetical protein n=1 Tax=Pedobacter sp. FW305-3-2-15-E-R2A2 TaxID=3140251 RepID=UPI0031400D70